MSARRKAHVTVTVDALDDAAECLAWQHQWDRVGPIVASGGGSRGAMEFRVSWRCMRCGSERHLPVDIYGRRTSGGYDYDYSDAFMQAARADADDNYTRKEGQRALWLHGARKGLMAGATVTPISRTRGTHGTRRTGATGNRVHQPKGA